MIKKLSQLPQIKLLNRNLTDLLYGQEEEDNGNQYSDNQLSKFLLSVIIIIGIIGNILNIKIFGKSKMRKGSTFRFLHYLSISDLLVLLVCSTEALARFGFQVEIRSHSTIICKLHTFLTYFLTHNSSIILMIISVDRALVITSKNFPFFKRSSKTKMKKNHSVISFERASTKIYRHKFQFNCLLTHYLHRVDLVLIIIIAILILLNLHYLLFIDLNLKSLIHNTNEIPRNFLKLNFNITQNIAKNTSKKIIIIRPKEEPVLICFPNENTKYYYFLNNIWVWIDICVYSLIPYLIMSICSVIILTRIQIKSKKYFNRLNNRNSQSCKTNFYRRLKRNRQLLYMLLLTNLYFLLTQLPYCILFVIYKGKSSDTSLGQPLVHFLLYTNNAINFLFYGLSSQKYRNEFLSIFSKNNKKNNSKFFSIGLQTNPNDFQTI